jgi:hypothetical protein
MGKVWKSVSQLITLKCTFKIVKMVNFMICVFFTIKELKPHKHTYVVKKESTGSRKLVDGFKVV